MGDKVSAQATGSQSFRSGGLRTPRSDRRQVLSLPPEYGRHSAGQAPKHRLGPVHFHTCAGKGQLVLSHPNTLLFWDGVHSVGDCETTRRYHRPAGLCTAEPICARTILRVLRSAHNRREDLCNAPKMMWPCLCASSRNRSCYSIVAPLLRHSGAQCTPPGPAVVTTTCEVVVCVSDFFHIRPVRVTVRRQQDTRIGGPRLCNRTQGWCHAAPPPKRVPSPQTPLPRWTDEDMLEWPRSSALSPC